MLREAYSQPQSQAKAQCDYDSRVTKEMKFNRYEENINLYDKKVKNYDFKDYK